LLVLFGLGNNKLVLNVEYGASLLVYSDVELVPLLEILGDVDWFLWELELFAGVRVCMWEDNPVGLTVKIVGAQSECGVGADCEVVDLNFGEVLGFSVKDIQLILVFALGLRNGVQMEQLMGFVHLLDTSDRSRIVESD